jgi:hypothetical protein
MLKGMDHFHFPIEEGTVWSEAAVGDGSISMSTEMGGCELFSIDVPASDALPLELPSSLDKGLHR